jgi:ubiquitin carboxyl-terminal hydrolase 36/42
MQELKFKPKPKKEGCISIKIKAMKGSGVNQNAMHLMTGMPVSWRRGPLECMHTHHSAKQGSRRCPASDPVDKKKRKLVVQC